MTCVHEVAWLYILITAMIGTANFFLGYWLRSCA
jgi:hypothetical protein